MKKEVISQLRREHGDGFVAKIMLGGAEPVAANGSMIFEAPDVVRMLSQYMKILFSSLGKYVNGIGIGDILDYEGDFSASMLKLYVTIQDLLHAVSSSAQTIACEFLDTIVRVFNYVSNLVKSHTSQETKENVAELTQQIYSCKSYMSRLGEGGMGFVQWLARKVRATLNYLHESVISVFSYVTAIAGNVAENFSNVIGGSSSIGQAALRLGLYAWSTGIESTTEAFQLSLNIKQQKAYSSQALLQNTLAFVKAMGGALAITGELPQKLARLMGETALADAYMNERNFIFLADRGISAMRGLFGSLSKWLQSLVGTKLALFDTFLHTMMQNFSFSVMNALSIIAERYNTYYPMNPESTIEFAEKLQMEKPTEELDIALRDAKRSANAFQDAVQKKPKMSWAEKIDTKWVFCGAIVNMLERKPFTKQQLDHLSKFLKPIENEVEDQLASYFVLRNALPISLFSDEGTTTVEEDEEFARLYSRSRVGANENESLTTMTPVDRVRILRGMDIVHTMEIQKMEDSGASSEQIETLKTFFRIEREELLQIDAQELQDNEKQRLAWGRFQPMLMFVYFFGIIALVASAAFHIASPDTDVMNSMSNFSVVYKSKPIVRSLVSATNMPSLRIDTWNSVYQEDFYERFNNLTDDKIFRTFNLYTQAIEQNFDEEVWPLLRSLPENSNNYYTIQDKTWTQSKKITRDTSQAITANDIPEAIEDIREIMRVVYRNEIDNLLLNYKEWTAENAPGYIAELAKALTKTSLGRATNVPTSAKGVMENLLYSFSGSELLFTQTYNMILSSASMTIFFTGFLFTALLAAFEQVHGASSKRVAYSTAHRLFYTAQMAGLFMNAGVRNKEEILELVKENQAAFWGPIFNIIAIAGLLNPVTYIGFITNIGASYTRKKFTVLNLDNSQTTMEKYIKYLPEARNEAVEEQKNRVYVKRLEYDSEVSDASEIDCHFCSSFAKYKCSETCSQRYCSSKCSEADYPLHVEHCTA